MGPVLTPSLERMFRTWLFTVSSVRDSCAAILCCIATRNQPQYVDFSRGQRVVGYVFGDFGGGFG